MVFRSVAICKLSTYAPGDSSTPTPFWVTWLKAKGQKMKVQTNTKEMIVVGGELVELQVGGLGECDQNIIQFCLKLSNNLIKKKKTPKDIEAMIPITYLH